MKRMAALLAGVIFALLGILWFLQGTGILTIPPILCFANCEPIIGGSPVWLAVGVVVSLIGIIIIAFSLKGRTIHEKNSKDSTDTQQ